MEPDVPQPLARMAMLTDSEDDQALTVHSKATKIQRKPLSLSDSDDDDDDDNDNDLNTRGLSAVDNLNIPDRLKRLMRDAELGDDDSDSEDDDDPLKDNALFRTPAAVKASEVQSMLRTAPPPLSPAASPSAKEKADSTTKKPQRKPQQRKKKQSAATSDADGSASSPQAKEAVDPMTRPRAPFEFLHESSSNSDESDYDDGAERPEKTKQKKLKDKQRPAKRAMSKQAELKMHMENQRLARQMVATLQPRMNKLSFKEIVERLKNKQEQQQQQQQQQEPIVDADAERQKRAAKNHARMMLKEDDDLEIVNIPPQLRALALASPEQPRQYAFQQFQQTSPQQQRRFRHVVTHGDLNKRLQSKIAQEMLSRRKELQDKAKARGEFKTPAEIAQEQLAKEKQAEVIGLQIKQHFTKDTTQRKKKEKEHVPEEDDILEYSGESEDEAEEDEDLVMSVAEEDEEENETTNASRTDDQPLVSNEDQERDQLLIREDQDDEAVQNRKRKWKNAILSDSGESSSDDDRSDNEGEVAESGSSSDGATAKKSKQNNTPKQKNHYLDAEAEEEEDEYFGAGGPEDSDEGEDLDRFEQDGMLNDKVDEHVDEEALRAALNSQLAESDKHMVDRLVKDILSGDLRRRRAARESGLMLDDFDLFDDREDNDLVALRRAANEERRRRLQNSDDPLVALARDPKTSAFAKALQPLPENAQLLDLSDHEEEQDTQAQSQDEDENEDGLDPRSNLSLVIPEEEEEEDEEGMKMILDDDDDDLDHALSMIEQRKRTVVSTDQSMQDFFSGRRIGTQK